MKRVFFWLYLLAKRQLKNPVITFLLIALPVGVAIFSNVSALKKAEAPKIGIVVMDDDPIARLTLKYVTSGEYTVDFYEVESPKQLEKDILSGKAECGYIIKSGLKGKLDNNDYAECIETVIKGSKFISSMTNEVMFAAMFKAYSIEVAVNYFDSIEKYADYARQAELEMRKSYEEYLNSTDTFHINFMSLDENGEATNEIKQQDGKFPIDKILVILIYIAGLFGTVQFYMDEERGTFVTLSKGYRIAGRPVYAFMGSVFFAISSLICLAILDAGKFPLMIFKMIVYVIAITAFSWLVSMLVRSSRGMISIIPVLLIACFIICPVFVNLVAYLPVIRILQKLLLPYYMM